jgi:Mn2+/Fe2+ NRAMP family transporter
VRGTLIPEFRFDSGFLSMLVAILGTAISPYLFFWQTNQEVEEKRSTGQSDFGSANNGHRTAS